jgi:hypothetical protein
MFNSSLTFGEENLGVEERKGKKWNDFPHIFHDFPRIFRENSVYLHRFNEIIYKVWKEKSI